eukprot:g3281.t1
MKKGEDESSATKRSSSTESGASPIKDSKDPFLEKRTIDVGGTRCELLNDAHFCKLRKVANVSVDFLKTFNFSLMGNGGGKGGSSMALTKDSKYIVKDITGSDSSSLSRMSGRLVDHCIRMIDLGKTKKRSDGSVPNSRSFISQIYAHFKRPSDGRCFMAVASVIPDVKSPEWDEVYDLKGCRDDKLLISAGKRVNEVHMRCWKVPYFCCLSVFGATPQRRKSYYEGKVKAFAGEFLHFDEKGREDILRCLRSDTKFFASEGTMDYSMILGVRRCPLSSYTPGVFPKGTNGSANQPFLSVRGKTVWAYYIGIIDFLQEWDCTKQIAACIKCCCAPKPLSTVPPTTYAEQFYTHFETRLMTKRLHGDALPARCPAPSFSSRHSSSDDSAIAPPSASPSPVAASKKSTAKADEVELGVEEDASEKRNGVGGETELARIAIDDDDGVST